MAVTLPESVPIKALPRIETFAAPPLTPPSNANARFMNDLLAPVTVRNAAKRINIYMTLAETPSGSPHKPCKVNV